jgi:hypothetical protein
MLIQQTYVVSGGEPDLPFFPFKHTLRLMFRQDDGRQKRPTREPLRLLQRVKNGSFACPADSLKNQAGYIPVFIHIISRTTEGNEGKPREDLGK